MFQLLFVVMTCILVPIKGQNVSQPVIEDITSIFTTGTVNGTGNCTELPNVEVQFWLYTKEVNRTILDPDNPLPIDTSKPIVMIIHGWMSSGNTYYLQEMKNAFVQNILEIQVIMVDWSSLAAQDYVTAYCNVPQVAQIVAKFIDNLNDSYGLNLSKLHVVGHSLGAQTAGIAGQSVQQNGSIGRITGLDPAGPLYQGLPDDERLTEDDADFVEVIHTNSGALGYIGDCGDVDFYVNCGSQQPGCAVPNITMIKMLNNSLAALPVINDLLCDHIRSCMYFTESIGNGVFMGNSCSLCPTICSQDFAQPETLVMGEYTPTTFDKNKYLVLTNAQSPYAKPKTNF